MIEKKLMASIAVAILLSTVACTYEREDNRPEPGRYEHKRSYIDENGTRVENQDSTEVTVNRECRRDANHHCKRHVSKKSKTTVDPKGLFNKKTTHESNEETDR